MRSATTLAVLVGGLALAGCGSSGGGTNAMTDMAMGSSMDMGSTAPAAMDMTQLAKATQGDEEIVLSAMAPETFYVSDGTGLRKQAPGPDDRAHMMVTVSDRASGIRLPDATVTLRLTGPTGRSVFDGPLYPMIGRGMGMHYGENVPLPQTGRYHASLVVGPSRIGRHRSVRTAWTSAHRIDLAFAWDGSKAAPAT